MVGRAGASRAADGATGRRRHRHPPRRQRMRIGAFIFPTEYSIPVAELAPPVEDRGFESLFVTEHTHIPVSRRTPWPGGGPLPKEYAHTLDPFVGLAAPAAVTGRPRAGPRLRL